MADVTSMIDDWISGVTTLAFAVDEAAADGWAAPAAAAFAC